METIVLISTIFKLKTININIYIYIYIYIYIIFYNLNLKNIFLTKHIKLFFTQFQFQSQF